MNGFTSTNWELDEVLEQCLAQIVAGKAGVEACLASHSDIADKLAPMLLAVQRLWEIPKPMLSSGAKARIEARVRTAAGASGARRPGRQHRPRVAVPWWRWALSPIAAVLICAVLTLATVTVSAQALPGSAFYPVKLGTEDTWLWLAPAQQEPRLHLRFAQRRLAEAEELAVRGRFEPSVIEAVAAQIEAALTKAAVLPPDQALLLLAKAEAVIKQGQQTFSWLQVSLPPADQPDIARALGEVAALVAQAGEIRTAMSPYGPVASPSKTGTVPPAGALTTTRALGTTSALAPASTPVASGTITATATLLATQALAAGPISGPTASRTSTPSPTPTPTPTPTSTAASSSLPTAPTPTPRPANRPTQPTPTNTQAPPTNTPSPTKTQAPQTNTPSPTDTQAPPTNTPFPTDTLAPPTDTPPLPPSDTPSPPPTKQTPPGQTHTPQPPGHTKTPQP